MELLRKAYIYGFCAACATFFFISNTAFASTLKLDAADVEKFFDAAIQQQMAEFNIPNAAVTIVVGGEVVMAKGYGYAELDKEIPVDPGKTLFRIASTSKLFTWTAVMQLAEQGKICLKTDINEYLDFEIPASLAYGQHQSDLEPITLNHLMSHTPGFEDYVTGLFSLNENHVLPLAQHVRKYLPARIFPPGEVIAYSNYGAALAAYIVEQVSGVPFAQYIEDNIFEPLLMKQSTFEQPLPERMASNMARAYRYVEGEFQEGKFEFFDQAGSMSSTASDMARFMLAHLQRGQLEGASILREETAIKMHSQLFTHHPFLDGMAHGFVEGRYNEKRVLSHGGGTLLYYNDLYILPEEQVGLFIVHSGGHHIVHNELFQAFMDHYFPVDDAPVPPPHLNMAERSSKYTGEYNQNRRSFTGEDKFLSLFMGQIHVDVDKEGYLLVSHMGETNQFLEIDPGVYYNLRESRTPDVYGNFQTIVFGNDPFGNTMLMPDGPMSYSKAPWYETTIFNLIIAVSAVLIVIISLFYWGIKAFIQRIMRDKSKQPKEVSGVAQIAKGTAMAFGFLTFVSILETIVLSQPDPVYGLPATAYGETPAWASLFELMPLMMAILGIAVVIFTVIAWWKGYWRIPGRIHYSLFAAATILLLWLFSYWNFI